MTVAEIMEQAQTLSPNERKELAMMLISSLEIIEHSKPEQQEEHWGKALNKLMDEIGPIEMKYPEIEDPVEWVKHLRVEQRQKRLGDWSEGE